METLPLRSIPKRNRIWPYVLIVLFIIVTGILLYIYYPYASTKKNMYFTGKYPILIKGAIQGNAIHNENSLYIPLKLVEKQIDDSIYEESKSLIITTKLKVIRIPFNENVLYVNEKPKQTNNPIVKIVSGQKYISLEILQALYPIEYQLTKHTGIVWIRMNGEQYHNGKIVSHDVRKAFLRLRTKPNLQSSYNVEVKKGEAVHIERELKNYYYIRTLEGIGGYIKKAYVMKQKLENVQIAFPKEAVTLPAIEKPIQMSWEAVYKKTPDPSQFPTMAGVNVVSPTWFHLKDDNGNITNLLSSKYVKWAKQQHMQVWALFSNSSNPDLTKAALSTFEKRNRIIQTLLKVAKKEHLEGINIDIENVRSKDGPLVTQFVREISAYFHANHKYVSMDITFIAKGNWSEFYERKKLGKIVDYLIIMAYDEHWATSAEAGSVASLPWVENGLKPILKLVPNDKIILGVPFYTRLWKEEWKDGQKQTSSIALTMDQANKWIKKKKATIQMDTESGQHYTEYIDSKTNTTYKMWMEDTYSLAKRADIAGQYKLSGIASWARAFGNEDAWVALRSTLSAYNQK
ncbi:glycosyl hydrolase family 18 protein [Heyndrickxia camelliae]|nr:glycosyl hydrolase family 18 protein [Heyndrickxia camelliae]